jgi:ferredoxin
MITLATLSVIVFERKAFCRYFCSVGRTIGFYAELSPVALRPVDPDRCANCKSLECFHGSDQVEPCPTHLVMGRLQDNRYCTSCGACTFSCPYHNVNWRWQNKRIPQVGRQRLNRSEAWFILILASLTSFHGLTMLPLWENSLRELGLNLSNRGQLLGSFTLGMALVVFIAIGLYAVTVKLTQWRLGGRREYARLFSYFALPLLPIAFAYHIAHNLSHLFRESQGFGSVLQNPFGLNTLPLTMAERHARHLNPLVSDEITFALQALLFAIGFWWALRLLLRRVNLMQLNGNNIGAYFPVLIFLSGFTLFNLWLLMQPMIMRM